MNQEDEPKRLARIKQHLKDNKKVYLAAAGGVVVGGTTVGILMLRRTGFPLEISQTAKNQALINWKPEIIQVALVKKCCPDPIPVLDKTTGIPYPSMKTAARLTQTAYDTIRKDVNGLQSRFEKLPDSVYA